jgi:hypothetical protein
MDNLLTQQINLKFNQDWTRVISTLNHAIEMVRSNSDKITKSYKYSDYGHHYEFGSAGTIAHVTNGSSYWYNMNGPLITKLTPWLDSFMKDVAPIKPTFITLNKLIGDGAEHRDQPGQNTGLNYFLETTNSITYCKDLNVEESYSSIKDTAWILNIQKKHRIINPDTRIWFNLRFEADFETCKEFFKDKNFVY